MTTTIITRRCCDDHIPYIPLFHSLRTCVPTITFHLSLSSTVYDFVSRPSHSIYPSLPLSTTLCRDHHIPSFPLFHYLRTCVGTITFHLSLSSTLYELVSRPSPSIVPSLILSTNLCPDHHISSIPLFHYLRTCIPTITFHLSLSSTIYELVSRPSYSTYPSLPLFRNLCPDHHIPSIPFFHYLRTCVPTIIFHLSLSSIIYEFVSRPSYSIYPSLPLSTNLCPDSQVSTYQSSFRYINFTINSSSHLLAPAAIFQRSHLFYCLLSSINVLPAIIFTKLLSHLPHQSISVLHF